jgi:hypothetical protein
MPDDDDLLVVAMTEHSPGEGARTKVRPKAWPRRYINRAKRTMRRGRSTPRGGP